MREISYKVKGHDGLIYTRHAKRSNHKGWYKTQGYIKRRVENHPFADKRGYVGEHRLVMEAHLGRFLTDREIVHHKDQNRSNNDLSNLELIDQSTHAAEHMTGKRNPNGRLIASEPIFEEIKFRLLNKNTSLMETKTLSQLIGKTYRRGQFSFRGRFTGLHDKNGKEIYEGDIVVKKDYPYYVYKDGVNRSLNDPFKESLGIVPNYRGQVEWYYSGWQVSVFSVNDANRGGAVGESLNEDGLDEGKKSKWEILGNIYEHKHLLESPALKRKGEV